MATDFFDFIEDELNVCADDDLDMIRADDFNARDAGFLDLILVDSIHVFDIDTKACDTRLDSCDVAVTAETIIGKLQRGIQLEANELEAVAEFLRGARKLKRFMFEREFFAPLLSAYAAGMGEWRTLEEDITQAIRAGQVVDEASKELKRIRKQVDILEGRIEERLAKFLKSAANREMIQDGFITKKQDRFTIPIKASYKHKVAGTIVDTSNRGTTVFIEPEAISKLNAELVVKRTEEAVEVYQVLATLTGAVAEVLPEIEATLDVIAQYDMVFAKGKYSQSIDGVTPHVNASGRI